MLQILQLDVHILLGQIPGSLLGTDSLVEGMLVYLVGKRESYKLALWNMSHATVQQEGAIEV